MGLGPSLNISFESLKNPEGMIEKANANVRRIRPQVSDELGSPSAGVVASGGVIIDTTPSKRMVRLRKKKKPKNTRKAKRKKSRK